MIPSDPTLIAQVQGSNPPLTGKALSGDAPGGGMESARFLTGQANLTLQSFLASSAMPSGPRELYDWLQSRGVGNLGPDLVSSAFREAAGLLGAGGTMLPAYGLLPAAVRARVSPDEYAVLQGLLAIRGVQAAMAALSWLCLGLPPEQIGTAQSSCAPPQSAPGPGPAPSQPAVAGSPIPSGAGTTPAPAGGRSVPELEQAVQKQQQTVEEARTALQVAERAALDELGQAAADPAAYQTAEGQYLQAQADLSAAQDKKQADGADRARHQALIGQENDNITRDQARIDSEEASIRSLDDQIGARQAEPCAPGSTAQRDAEVARLQAQKHEAEQRRDAARHDLEAARARLATQQALERTAGESLLVDEARIQEHSAALETALEAMDRARGLDGSIERELACNTRVQAARQALQAAEASLRSLQAQLEAARTEAARAESTRQNDLGYEASVARQAAVKTLDSVTSEDRENCIKKAADLARPDDTVLFLGDTQNLDRDDAGHVVLLRDGQVIDPSAPDAAPVSTAEFLARHPWYASQNDFNALGTCSGAELQAVLDAATPWERQQALQQAGLQDIAGVRFADPPPGYRLDLEQAVPQPDGTLAVSLADLQTSDPQTYRRLMAACELQEMGGEGFLGFTLRDGKVFLDSSGYLLPYDSTVPSALAVFERVDMESPAEVQAAFQAGLALTGYATSRPLNLSAGTRLTPDQIAAYQALGYQVGVFDAASGHMAVRGSGDQPADTLDNITRLSDGSGPLVYVLVGGPPVDGIGDLDPARVTLLQQDQGFSLDPSELGDLNDTEKTLAILGAFTRAPRPRPGDYQSYQPVRDLDALVTRAISQGQVNPAVASAVAYGLAFMACHPETECDGSVYADIAASLAGTSAQAARSFLEQLGPDVVAFVPSLQLALPQPGVSILSPGSGLGRLLQSASELGPQDSDCLLPLVAVTLAQAPASLWGDPSFTNPLAKLMATINHPDDPQRAESESERLASLLRNDAVVSALGRTPESRDRQGLVLLLMSNDFFTSERVDDFHGNLQTLSSELSLRLAGETVVSPLLGDASVNPDGTPLLALGTPISWTSSTGLDPALADKFSQLQPQPPTEAVLAAAIASGTITYDDAASYLEGLARRAETLGDPVTFGASNQDAMSGPARWLRLVNAGIANPVHWISVEFDPTVGNPITASHLDELARYQAEQLRLLRDKMLVAQANDDPLQAAQLMAGGSLMNDAFTRSLPFYGMDVARQGAEVTASLRALRPVAQILGPFAAGMLGTVAGGPPGGALAAAAMTGALTGTFDAVDAGFDITNPSSASRVPWGQVGGAAVWSGFTTYIAVRYAELAKEAGVAWLRAVGTSGAIDGFGQLGSLLIAHPELARAILEGDSNALATATDTFATGFTASFLLNGVLYRRGSSSGLQGAGDDWSGNHDEIVRLLSGESSGAGGRLTMTGLDGRAMTLDDLLGARSESYFAVYKKGDQTVIVEVAQAAAGNPYHLDTEQVLKGISGNSPGADWQVLGGFHNQPGGMTVPSEADRITERILRGQFGDGFVNLSAAANEGSLVVAAFGSDMPPLKLADAVEQGLYDVGFDDPMVWRGDPYDPRARYQVWSPQYQLDPSYWDAMLASSTKLSESMPATLREALAEIESSDVTTYLRRSSPEFMQERLPTMLATPYAVDGVPTRYGLAGGDLGTIQERARALADAAGGLDILKGTIDGQSINLTVINYSRWLHLPLEESQASLVWDHMQQLYARALDPSQSIDETVRSVAELNWWYANVMPYQRGSATSAEVLTKSIFDARGIDISVWRPGISPDLEALVTPMELYVSGYPNLFAEAPRWKGAGRSPT